MSYLSVLVLRSMNISGRGGKFVSSATSNLPFAPPQLWLIIATWHDTVVLRSCGTLHVQ